MQISCCTCARTVMFFCNVLSKLMICVKNKVEQLEAGNLYPVRISRTVRAQKTRTKLKELLVNRQISLKKYASGQGQLNVVIKDKEGKTTGHTS